MRARRSGQAATEFAVMYGIVVLPLIFMTIFMAQALWIWNGMVEFTRDGARYAATHYCAQSDGSNVLTYMQTHVPPMVDQAQFQAGGQATIDVRYSYAEGIDPATCGSCIPDGVTVSVSNYNFGRMAAFLRQASIPLPPFTTNLPMESAGLDPAGNSVCQ
jgi:hypothetical protein